MSTYHTPNIAHVNHIELNIIKWEQSLDFYTNMIGLYLIEQQPTKAVLGSSRNQPLITLHKLTDGATKQAQTTGLYHLALLVPSRKDLGIILRHLILNKVMLQGASNHGISEAIYLADPDGNGIEIAADTNPLSWPWRNGKLDILSTNGPMDINDVIHASEYEPFTGLSSKTILGHVHLHVDDLDAARNFYENILNMDVVIELPKSAVFLSNGNYHHHIAINVWNGLNAKQPEKQQGGLKNYTFWVPTYQAFMAIKDRLVDANIPFQETNNQLVTQDPANNQLIIKTRVLS